MIIYKITNKINGKTYIGQSVNQFNNRYNGGKWWLYTHNKHLKNSVNKYGLDNFDVEILEEDVKSIEDLNFYEIKYAEEYKSYTPFGYNVRGCGDNKFVTDELKEELSKFRLGKDYSPKNKKHSEYKGVSWSDSKMTWKCRIQNKILTKDKYAQTEIEAAEIYDKVSLFLLGPDCHINFEERRGEYLSEDLEKFYKEIFLAKKAYRVENRYTDTTELLEKIKMYLWKEPIPNISKIIGVSIRKISYCLRKYNVDRPNKNYWQKNRFYDKK
jgi:group I intron endonuclease